MSKVITTLFVFVALLLFPSLSPAISLDLIVSDIRTGEPISGAHIVLEDTTLVVATDARGRAFLDLPLGIHPLICSHVGYREQRITLHVDGKHPVIHLRLEPLILPMQEAVVERVREPEAIGQRRLAIREVARAPSPTSDPLRFVKVLPGVSSGNDFSSRYSALGGSYTENLLYINGVEFELPLQVRRGLTETLSPVNADMVEHIEFRAGNFPVYYGDKLSSMVAVDYRRPRPGQSGRVHGSPLQQGLVVEGSRNAFSYIAGLRRANLEPLTRGLPSAGRFVPRFVDGQALLRWQRDEREELSLFLQAQDSDFSMRPDSLLLRSGCSGRTMVCASRYWGNGEGSERFVYATRVAAARWRRAEGWEVFLHVLEQEEKEATDLLYNLRGDGLNGTLKTSEQVDGQLRMWRTELGLSRQHGEWHWGGGLRRTDIDGWRQNRQQVADDDRLYLQEGVKQAAKKEGVDGHLYGQRQWRRGRLRARTGLRLSHFDLSDEFLLLPRVELDWQAPERLQLLVAGGRYAQPPLYREYLDADATARLHTQKAWQASTGLRYEMRGATSAQVEIFFRHLVDLIPYDIDDLNLVYAGSNSARGRVWGANGALRGEVNHLVGIFSYSWLMAREEVVGDGRGWIRRPGDQRHTLSAYLEDRMQLRFTHLHSSRFHLRLLYGSGFPHTPKLRDPEAGDSFIMVDGARQSRSGRSYFRFDIGATQDIKFDGWQLEIREEIINLFDQYNVVGYTYLPTGRGVPVELPRGLGRRLYNVRLALAWN